MYCFNTQMIRASICKGLSILAVGGAVRRRGEGEARATAVRCLFFLLLSTTVFAQNPTVVRTIGPFYKTIANVGRDSIVVSMWPALHSSWPSTGMGDTLQYFPRGQWSSVPPTTVDWRGNFRVQMQRISGAYNDSVSVAVHGIAPDGYIVQNTIQYAYGSASTYVAIGDTARGRANAGKVYNNPNVVSGLFDPFNALLLDIKSADTSADTSAGYSTLATRWKIIVQTW